jgi:transcriptional regulator with XRE-family HTH domain
MKSVRLRVREIREAKGLTQRELARRSGIMQASLSAIETGRTKGIDFVTLARLADTLGIDPALLIATTEPIKKRGR